MSDSWIAQLHEKVSRVGAQTTGTFATLADHRHKITIALERTLKTLGERAEQSAQRLDAPTQERVLQALRQQSYDRLSIRERRYAASLFTHVPATTMRPFLEAYPRNWRVLAAECLRCWGDFGRHQDRSAYVRLLCLAPPEVGFLHQGLRPQDLLAPDGPAVLARAVPANDLLELRDALTDRGFDRTWSFTANTMAEWLSARAEHRQTFTKAWVALNQDRYLETALLPALVDKASSWFSAEKRPARVRRSVTAHATALAAMIRAAYLDGAEPAHWNAFVENLLRSTFGDPRIPPRSEGWEKLRQRDQPAFDRFMQRLISEDITVFFEHAMVDTRRRDFWLNYVPSLRRTVCVLDVGTHERLTKKFVGADEKFSAAIARANRFKKRTCVQAFCLYFESIVVVEFAESGNAAQIYSRDYFQQHFEQSLRANACNDHTALKTSPSVRRTGVGERILHQAHKWEAGAEAQLAAFGISPDHHARQHHARYR